MVRPFTIGRLTDLLRLARTYRTVKHELVADAMMVSSDRAIELLRQAEEMGLLTRDGYGYCSTKLGHAFFDAFTNNDKDRLDDILSEYPPYFNMKNALSQSSASLHDLRKATDLNEVEVELILRLIRYTRDDLCSMGDKFYLRSKELPNLTQFITALKRVYKELNAQTLWGLSKELIRMDLVAKHVCTGLRLTIDDFSKLLERAQKVYPLIEVNSDGIGYEFLPFLSGVLTPRNYRGCYLRLRM